MAKSLHIGIALELSYEYARAVLRGIVSYARPSRPWVFHLLEARPEKFAANQGMKHLDGVIGTLIFKEMTDHLKHLGVRAVNISHQRRNTDVARVGANDFDIGRIAARYFLDRGYTHFGFVGNRIMANSCDRESSYAHTLAEASMNYSSLETWISEQRLEAADQYEQMQRWLTAMPRPLALFAANDSFAWSILEVCRDAAIAVPESVSVVGVDNDPMICLLSSPQLSSIAVPAERIGYEAAAMLDGIFTGRTPPAEPLLLPAKEVVTRQSSNVLAIGDGELALAVKYIRQHAGDRIGVRDVVKATGVPRRSLERKFRQMLGRSPLEEIRRSRLERVRELLVNTDLAMPDVAERSGFDSAVRLTTVFREEMGMTPTGYRRQYRMVGAGQGGEKEPIARAG